MNRSKIVGFGVLFFLFSQINAMQRGDQVGPLIDLFNFIDKTKLERNPECKNKVAVTAVDGSTLLCIHCKNPLFSSKRVYVIGRFGADSHVHIVHKECFKAGKTNPCPYCKDDSTAIRGTCSYYEEMDEIEKLNSELFGAMFESMESAKFVKNLDVDLNFKFFCFELNE